MVGMRSSGLWTDHDDTALPLAGQLVVAGVAVTGIAVGLSMAAALTAIDRAMRALRRDG